MREPLAREQKHTETHDMERNFVRQNGRECLARDEDGSLLSPV